MKKQLLTLQQLISIMDPELYRHFGMILAYLSLWLRLLTVIMQRNATD